MRRMLPGAFLLALLAGPAFAAPLEIASAWLREPPPGSGPAAIYMELHNRGDAPVAAGEQTRHPVRQQLGGSVGGALVGGAGGFIAPDHLGFGLQPVADATRPEIVDRQPGGDGTPLQDVHHG